MLTNQHVQNYLRHLEDDRRLAPRTIREYRQQLVRLVDTAVPVESAAIAAYVGRSSTEGDVAPATRNHRLIVARGFFRFLCRSGEIEGDPTGHIERAKVPRSSKLRLGIHDLERALGRLELCPPDWRQVRDNTLIRLLFYTGLRVSEVREVDFGQIDLEHGFIKRVHRKGCGFSDMILNDAAYQAVCAWLAVRPYSQEEALFINRYRRRLSVRMIEKRLKVLGEQAGIGVPLTPHALRHLHATALNDAGVSTEVIRRSMNHSSVTTTQRYIHSDERILREALEKLPHLSPVGNDKMIPT
jgi:site-specific recombinase XerD